MGTVIPYMPEPNTTPTATSIMVDLLGDGYTVAFLQLVHSHCRWPVPAKVNGTSGSDAKTGQPESAILHLAEASLGQRWTIAGEDGHLEVGFQVCNVLIDYQSVLVDQVHCNVCQAELLFCPLHVQSLIPLYDLPQVQQLCKQTNCLQRLHDTPIAASLCAEAFLPIQASCALGV